MTTWNELTVDQRAYLDTLARAGGGWVTSSGKIEGIRPSEYWELRRDGFVDIEDMPDTMFWVKERITAKGLLVWQQGQTPDEPDELARLREQVTALTAERDALKASVPSLREPVFAIGIRVQLHGTVPRFTVGVVTSVKVYGGYVLKESTWEWVADTGEHVYCIRCDDGAIRHSSRDSMSKVNE